jgi:hypothetical protein
MAKEPDSRVKQSALNYICDCSTSWAHLDWLLGRL